MLPAVLMLLTTRSLASVKRLMLDVPAALAVSAALRTLRFRMLMSFVAAVSSMLAPASLSVLTFSVLASTVPLPNPVASVAMLPFAVRLIVPLVSRPATDTSSRSP